MNPSHLAAIVRMRWQMMRNRLRRSGRANWIITMVLLILTLLGSLGAFLFAVGWGKFFLAKIGPGGVIYVWDVLTVLFLFGWLIGLMTELQRPEMLSLKNLLHLPVSLGGAFCLNYASSLASLTLLIFLPAMLGLVLASVWHFGWTSLVVFGLLVSFLFMLTAVSYQLRGWLARLMENKRIRGTVIAVTTLVFVMIFQIPSMINWRGMRSWDADSRTRLAAHQERLAELAEQQKNGEIGADELAASIKAAEEKFSHQEKTFYAAKVAELHHKAKVINAILPIGWLAYGASEAAHGAMLSPWLCLLGMVAIGLVSLTLAYRATVRVYTGQQNNKRGQRAKAAGSAENMHVKDSMLQWDLPFLTEMQSVIAMATLRSMLRAPEAKMALITPLIFACIFGVNVVRGPLAQVPEIFRPWLGVGALGISLIGMAQMMLNQFGFDRQAFRAYVLAPAARRDVLLGKNIGIFPIVGALSAALVIFIGVLVNMQFTHVLANLLQIIVAFLIYFMISNYTSIAAPIGMLVGTTRPVAMNFKVIAVQFVAVLLMPLAIVPASLALGTELLVVLLGGIGGVPLYLLLTLIELPLVIWFYVKILNRQGQYLQRREQAILEVISKVAD